MKSIIYCLFIGLFLVLPASADVYDVTISSVLDATDDPVFGFEGTFPVTLTIKIDSDSGFNVPMDGSEWPKPGPNLYGYSIGAISMNPLVVGTTTFDKDDIEDLKPATGYSAAIWFDAPLSDGAAPYIWLYFSNANGTLELGSAACGSSCGLMNYASAYDEITYASAYSTSFTVQVTKSIEKVAIPTLSEWGMIIMSLLLAGSAIWMIRRHQLA